MSSALIAHAQLRDVTFSESKLDDVNFRMCQGDRVVFDDVNLQRADFYAAHLMSARFFRLRHEWDRSVSGESCHGPDFTARFSPT